jgi:nucleoside-diphosphate-sugar epimerase
MRIAITGATGNIGTAVRRALERDNAVEEIVGIARRRPDTLHPKTRWVSADVAEDDLRAHFQRCDAVIALAWQFHPTRHPDETWKANVVGSMRTFDAAADAGVDTLIYASSVGAYSPNPGRRVDESWPTHSVPTAAYGREKAYVERVLDTFEVEHPHARVVRLRPAFVFQRAAATEQRRIFAGPFVPGTLADPRRLPFVPFPRGLRFQAVHSDDIAPAVAAALHSEARGAFNLAAEPVIDAKVLVDAFGARVVEVPARLARWVFDLAWGLHVVPAPPALFDLFVRLPVLDTTRAQTELGWSPMFSSVDALRLLIAGMTAGAGGDTPPLRADSLGERVHEVMTGVGERDL